MRDRKALRLHATALAAASWISLVWLHATPGLFDRFHQLRGLDFLQFYAAGRFVADGRIDQLYEWDAFAAALPQLVPGIGDLLYLPVYPPHLAALFAPMSVFGYLEALAVWTCVSISLYGASMWQLWRALCPLRPYRVEFGLLAAGFPAFTQLVAHGQISSLALGALLAAFLAFRSGYLFWTGVALGALAFKPQFATFALAFVLLQPSRALLAGGLLAVTIQVGATALAWGPEPWISYLEVVGRLIERPEAFEPKLWAMHSLRGAIELVVGSGRHALALWMVGAAVVAWLVSRAWRNQEAADARFAVASVGALLLNPHLYVYDLVLLAVPAAVLVARMTEAGTLRSSSSARLLYALLWIPLLGPLVQFTHLQLTTPVLVALLWQLGGRRPPATAACC